MPRVHFNFLFLVFSIFIDSLYFATVLLAIEKSWVSNNFTISRSDSGLFLSSYSIIFLIAVFKSSAPTTLPDFFIILLVKKLFKLKVPNGLSIYLFLIDLYEPNNQVNPDVILRMKDDKWIILINDRNLSRFKISNEYLNAAMNKDTPKEEKKFIDEHVSSAQSLLDTILFRSHTLRKVVSEIINVQHDYLSEKQQHPNPLKLEDIAKKINMDISSISKKKKNK